MPPPQSLLLSLSKGDPHSCQSRQPHNIQDLVASEWISSPGALSLQSFLRTSVTSTEGIPSPRTSHPKEIPPPKRSHPRGDPTTRQCLYVAEPDWVLWVTRSPGAHLELHSRARFHAWTRDLSHLSEVRPAISDLLIGPSESLFVWPLI